MNLTFKNETFRDDYSFRNSPETIRRGHRNVFCKCDCGTVREIGWKFNRWLDLKFMQKIL